MKQLAVVTDVGRDILQSAQSFKTPEAAVWEYVVNSLQYVDPGTVPLVDVLLDVPSKKITISDNGSGMGVDGLGHFFTMHGENLERRKGVPGRGKFGTGKSAAFGIGTALTVSTTQDGKRQTVRLDVDMIRAADGADVPIQSIESDVPADGEPNGTTIEISGISIKIAREPVVALIERHLSAFQGSPVVKVNGRVCEIVRPVAALTKSFTPPEQVAAFTGDVTLTISASSAPLDPIHRGVQITIGTGNLIAVEAAGVDTKEYGQHLFGHIDCPALDDPKYDPVAAYTNDRSMRLNGAHPVALALTTFIGASLEQVRAELVAEGKKARADDDAKRLKETTNKIEELLNADLKDFRDRLEGMSGTIRRRTPLEGSAGGDEEDSTEKVVDPAGTEPGREDGVGGENVDKPVEGGASGGGGGDGGTPGGENASPAGAPDAEGDESLSPAGTGHKRLRGGLSVDFDHYGDDYDRYRWDPDVRKITINLDHQVVKAAQALPDDEATFRRLCYEIAFTGYAVALADLQFERDPARDSSDATFEIRAALRRVWANAGALYAV